MDDHLIYAGVLVDIAFIGPGGTAGLGVRRMNTKFVKRLPWLR